MIRWIRTQSPGLIVYGGDVYNRGTEAEFEQFFDQMGRHVADMCEMAGNHDWETHSAESFPGRRPTATKRSGGGFRRRPRISRSTPRRRGGARYEHVKDIGGWRLVFVDTGPCNREDWPVGDPERPQWLRRVLTEQPGRAKIVFAHHSRLSRGKHGDNRTVMRSGSACSTRPRRRRWRR